MIIWRHWNKNSVLQNFTLSVDFSIVGFVHHGPHDGVGGGAPAFTSDLWAARVLTLLHFNNIFWQICSTVALISVKKWQNCRFKLQRCCLLYSLDSTFLESGSDIQSCQWIKPSLKERKSKKCRQKEKKKGLKRNKEGRLGKIQGLRECKKSILALEQTRPIKQQ